MQPERMATVYGYSPDVGSDVRFREAFAEYADFACFQLGRLENFDPYDLFYWEHRNSRWLANRYHEADLGHRVLLPYNLRMIQEVMLSVPNEYRLDQAFQKRLIEIYERP